MKKLICLFLMLADACNKCYDTQPSDSIMQRKNRGLLLRQAAEPSAR